MQRYKRPITVTVECDHMRRPQVIHLRRRESYCEITRIQPEDAAALYADLAMALQQFEVKP